MKRKKQPDESYVLFCSKLQNLLSYYLRSRKAESDAEKIVDVFVADRLKDSLSPSTLNYVLSLEADSTFSSDKVASSADIYVNNYTEDGKYRSASKPEHSHMYFGGKSYARPRENVSAAVTAVPTNVAGVPRSLPASFGAQNKPRPRLCFKCRSDRHLLADCPFRKSTQGRTGHTTADQPARVNACVQAADVRYANTDTALAEVTGRAADDCPPAVESADRPDNTGNAAVADVQSCVTGLPATSVDAIARESNAMRVMPLKFMKVLINGQPLNALVDSGSQLVLLNRSVLSNDVNTVGNIQVQGVFGNPVTADIAAVDVRRCNDDSDEHGVCMLSEPMQSFCGLVDNIASNYDMILPAEIADELINLPLFDVLPVTPQNDDLCVDLDQVSLDDNDMSESDECVIDVDHINEASVNVTATDPGNSDHSNHETNALIDEQQNDESLAGCRVLAAAGKGNFVYRNGVLYRSDRIFGHRIWQLVVPQGRREHVLKLGHETGAHLGIRKTSERIRLSFWWRGLKEDVQKYVSSCHSCQLRRRLKATDRVPITPIPRATRPFEMVVIDVIGPINPPAGPQKFKYVLCIVDSFSRFSSAYLLKDLTAKSTCQALLEFFSWAGVSSVVICDNGTNFNSALTKEFMKRMGCSPRFSSPNHPECQGMCERYNQTFKNMLHHAIREHGSQWHLLVPFLVWAQRESVNETTGVSPFMCVYGFTPRGPLSILQENWAGESELPPNFGKSASQYMQELKESLETVAGYVDMHATNAQERYARYYNLRARDKHFDVGDSVIVLTPDYNFSRTYARWIGPAVIAEVKSPYSYLVDMPDGSRRHFHANKLRPYVARVSNVGVINDSDYEFGHVDTPPNVADRHTDLKPSEKLLSQSPEKLNHLNHDQRCELLGLLDKYAECFSDSPGYCDVVCHEIKLKSDFIPKQSKAYRIPEILKPEVERQIDQLVRNGFLVPSKSPNSSPILCVLKGNNQIRIVCDFRYVNSFTVPDAYPMQNIDEVIDKIGHSKFISKFDARGAYWQTPVSPSDRWLTAIVTPSGLWEWTRTPFGMRNSGSTFVRAVQEVLRPVRDITASYVDDMAVGSLDWAAHMTHIDRFLSVIKLSGLTLNLPKCEFAMSEVKFVGQFVGSGWRRPDPEKFSAIRDMQRPITQKQLRSVLGLFGHFRDFIANYAELAKPLTDLTAKRVPQVLPWGEEAEQAFRCLKDKLCEASALAIHRPGDPVEIMVDASAVAIGACAMQGDRPIAYLSQKLSASQIKWSTIEREAFAVICALQKWHHLIFGVHTVLFSDHNPLTYVVECAPKSARLMRWSLALQQYDIELRYKKGEQNSAADCLSRI